MNNKGMSEIVQGIARMVFPFIMLYGISIVLYGHITPGGGFAGGVVLAGGFILLLLAFGKEYVFSIFNPGIAKLLESIGALGFISIAILGFAGGYFFYNIFPKGISFHLWSSGSIILSNIAIGIKIASGIFIAISALSVARLIRTKERIEYKKSVEEDR